MVFPALILGISLVISAGILFVGLTNQHTQVAYVAPTTQELMVELLKRTTKDVEGLTTQVKSIVVKKENSEQETKDIGQGPVTV
jgi:uncharacterized protein YlxW (UPF0749 family)